MPDGRTTRTVGLAACGADLVRVVFASLAASDLLLVLTAIGVPRYVIVVAGSIPPALAITPLIRRCVYIAFLCAVVHGLDRMTQNHGEQHERE